MPPDSPPDEFAPPPAATAWFVRGIALAQAAAWAYFIAAGAVQTLRHAGFGGWPGLIPTAFLGAFLFLSVLVTARSFRRASPGTARAVFCFALLLDVYFLYSLPVPGSIGAFVDAWIGSPFAGQLLLNGHPAANSLAVTWPLVLAYLGVVGVVMSFAWADLLVHAMQSVGLFGQREERAAEDGTRPWAGRMLLCLLATAPWLVALWWDRTHLSARPWTPGLLLAVGIGGAVALALACVVIRNSGYRRHPIDPVWPDREPAARRADTVDLRRIVRQKLRVDRAAAYVFLALLGVATIGHLALVRTGDSRPFPVLAITSHLPEAWATYAAWADANAPLVMRLLLGLLVAVAALWAWRVWRGGLIFATLTIALGLASLALAVVAVLTKLVWPVPTASVLLAALWVWAGLTVFRLWRLGPRDPRLDGRAVLRRDGARRWPRLFASGAAPQVFGWLALALLGVAFAALFALPMSLYTAWLGAESNPAYWPAKFCWRKARAAGAPAPEAARRDDARPPILLFRSLGDEHMPVNSPWFFGDALHAAWLTYEGALADRLHRRGPVISIGQPDEPAPDLGPTREFMPHDGWQSRAETLGRDAALIVLVIGRTGGAAWEFGRLVSLGVLGRVVLVLPPVDEMEVQVRWATFLEQLPRAGTPFEPLWKIDVRGVTAITFATEARPFCYVAPTRSRAAYRAAVDLAAQQILAKPRRRPKRTQPPPSAG